MLHLLSLFSGIGAFEKAIAALSDDPYFWYITDITLRSLGNIEK